MLLPWIKQVESIKKFFALHILLRVSEVAAETVVEVPVVPEPVVETVVEAVAEPVPE